MSRKVFISFLGTGNYKDCRFKFNDQLSSIVKFVQEALFQLVCKSYTKDFKIYIFLTKEAGNKYNKELDELIHKYSDLSIEKINDVPDGFTEEDIWNIFNEVYSLINENDTLYLDITHGFRSLPMLALSLINYGKSLKNIKVGGIYYGAFEALGPVYMIEEKFPDPNNRIAPILDLTSFSDLQDWSSASKVFLTSGNSTLLVDLFKSKDLSNFGESLSTYTKVINTTRLKDIISGSIALKVKEDIAKIKEIEGSVPMVDSILEKVEGHFNYYKENDVQNGLIAIDWCIQHGLIHQAYTLMSEYLISYVCELLQLKPYDKFNRDNVNAGLSLNNYDNFKYEEKNKVLQMNILKKLSELPNIKKLKERSKSINLENRHDILHAGMRVNPKSPDELILEAKQKFEKLKKVTSCS